MSGWIFAISTARGACSYCGMDCAPEHRRWQKGNHPFGRDITGNLLCWHSSAIHVSLPHAAVQFTLFCRVIHEIIHTYQHQTLTCHNTTAPSMPCTRRTANSRRIWVMEMRHVTFSQFFSTHKNSVSNYLTLFMLLLEMVALFCYSVKYQYIKSIQTA